MDGGVQYQGDEEDEEPSSDAALGGCPQPSALLPALHVAEGLLLHIALGVPAQHLAGRVFVLRHVAAHEGVEAAPCEGFRPPGIRDGESSNAPGLVIAGVESQMR